MMCSKYLSVIEAGCKCCGQLPTKELMDKFDEIRETYGRPIHVTSGFRCEKQNKKIGGSPKSNHCKGTAIDLKNLEHLDFYIEDLAYTRNWIHIQINPPKSGKRMFKP
jgi:hypothetical protein